MESKKVVFISALPLTPTSGGNIYNQELIKHASDIGVDFIYLESSDITLTLDQIDEKSSIIVDSICLKDTVKIEKIRNRKIYILMHLPPSQSEGLSDEKILEYRRMEHQWYTNFPIISAGKGAIDYIRIFIDPNIKFTIIPPGVNERWLRKSRYNATPKNLLVVSNIHRRKGIDVIIDTLSHLKDLEWKCDVYGKVDDEVYYTELLSKIKLFGMEHRIIIHKPISHESINAIMVEADLLIQFSIAENNSMSLLEAIASGLPFVSTATGNHEEFKQKNCGLIISNECTNHEAAHSLRLIFESSQAYRALCDSMNNFTVLTWREMAYQFISAMECYQ